MASYYKIERNRRSFIITRDALFVSMTVLNYGGQCQMLIRILIITSPSYESLVRNIISIPFLYAYNLFVTKFGKLCTIRRLYQDIMCFENFSEARYASDVTFEQSFRRSGSIKEVKLYFSGLHTIYC